MTEITPVHRFVDPGLNYLFSNNYDLSIRVMPDGFSYAVFDHLKQQFIAFEEFTFSAAPGLLRLFGSPEYINWLDQIIEQRVFLKEKFNKVFIITGGKKYTLMPVPLFEADNARKYLEFVHPLDETDKVNYETINALECNLIYAVPDALISWISYRYRSNQTFHVCGVLIRNFLMRFRGGSPVERIMVNIQTDVLDIIIFNDADLRFCNSFYFSNHNDLLYYLLFVIEQLKINSDESPLYLSGNVELNSELLKLLGAYIRYVDIIPENSDMTVSPSIDQAQLHRFFDLLNVSLCG